ncbi:tetratricopeptide repeat protein [Ferruginibacter albus]|uniref:tetratricopeptide repeat protein n=1 Tax=Ferruginibacter albus TaxID=2875540 RepID=UPI001CC4F469|nr:tetratricopeptide repeat protein [Ferruginibacter albus]UAY51586.1 tetratricopeptide repeat protein [Ferruginibacter albus]
MNTLRKGFLMMVMTVVASASFAQTIEDGKKFFFYERFESAKKVFSQLAANNVEATYWLGQSEIALEDVTSARTLYQNALMANSNSGLLLAGMGQIELLDGKTQDARQRFETAISLTQSKDAAVLNAIGFANIIAPKGDAYYAIDKLKQASTLKKNKDVDVLINLGDAYRKILDGGQAQTSFESAIAIDAKNPRPSYKIGKIYESQGVQQEDIFARYYNEAIAKDPTYSPVYYALYSYYYHRDVNKSKDYLDKYIANSDPSPKDCYYLASILYASGQFQQSIAKSDECIAADGANPYPNLFGLKAYAYDKLNDSVNAKSFFEQYLAKQTADKIGPTDYSTYAKNLLKFPGNDSLAGLNIDKAVALDSLEKDKLTDITVMLNYYTAQQNNNKVGDWYKKIIALRTQPVKSDYQSTGFSYYRAGNYPAAVAIFDSATKLFPDDVYSYYMLAKANTGIDTAMTLGSAVAPYQKVLELGYADTVKNKTQLMISYKYLIAYYANAKHDKATALMYCDKALALDPTDADIPKYKEAINRLNTRTPATRTTR